jgi:hypothetical protein
MMATRCAKDASVEVTWQAGTAAPTLPSKVLYGGAPWPVTVRFRGGQAESAKALGARLRSIPGVNGYGLVQRCGGQVFSIRVEPDSPIPPLPAEVILPGCVPLPVPVEVFPGVRKAVAFGQARIDRSNWLYGLLGVLGFGVIVGGFVLGTQGPRAPERGDGWRRGLGDQRHARRKHREQEDLELFELLPSLQPDELETPTDKVVLVKRGSCTIAIRRGQRAFFVWDLAQHRDVPAKALRRFLPPLESGSLRLRAGVVRADDPRGAVAAAANVLRDCATWA